MKDENIKDTTVEMHFSPSTIETIDTAVFNFLDETLDLRCSSNDGFVKVPIIWVSAERAYLAKKIEKLEQKME